MNLCMASPQYQRFHLEILAYVGEQIPTPPAGSTPRGGILNSKGLHPNKYHKTIKFLYLQALSFIV
jgi:hypothetical protein